MDTLLGFPLPPDAHVERALSLMPASDFHEAAFPPERPFHVETTFVGRAEALSALVDFARTPDRRRVAVVQGGGGSGKTSLLGAFLAALASPRVGVSVRCATDAPGGAPWLHRLPPGPCLVVMDDAHRRGSLTSLLPLARERDDVRLVLAVRPAGLPRIGSLLSQVGIEADEAAVLPPLSPLEPTEAEALAREVLGPEHAAHAPALAAASAGHPFVIVLGGRLIQEGALHPVALDPAADLAARVLDRAHDLAMLRAASTVEPRLCGSLLGLVAALAPVRVSDERFLQGAGDLFGCRRRDLVAALRALEGAGLLSRGAHGSEIVPRAFADHVLYRALVSSSSALEGPLAERARSLCTHFGTHAIVPLLRNTNDLSGPSLPEGRAVELSSSLWAHARAELAAAPVPDRCRMLGALRELASEQPAELLSIVERSLATAASASTLAAGALFSQVNVLYELPGILRRIGHHREYLPRACDLLWELGRDDLRLQSPHPDHPMRVLRELGSKAKERPAFVHEALLEAVDRWLRAPDAHEHKHSPLDVLDTFLTETSPEASRGESDRRLLSRRRALRDRALAVLSRSARSVDLRTALAGVGSLAKVLSDAPGSIFSDLEEPGNRDDERRRIIAMLREAAEGSGDALLHFVVADTLRRTARRATSTSLGAAAEEALAAVPDSAERRLYEALTARSPAQRMGEPPQSERVVPGPSGASIRPTDLCRSVINELLARCPSPALGARVVTAAMDALAMSGRSGSPRLLLHVMSRQDPTYAVGVCEDLMQRPEGPLGPHVASLLHALRESIPAEAGRLIASVVEAGDPTLCASIAQVFHRWVEKPIAGDQEALQRLLAHRDGFVRRAALGALRTLSRSSPRAAVDLAVGVDLSEGPEMAEALFGALDAGGLLSGETLSEEELILFLSRLRGARSLEGYSTMRFLDHAARRLPEEVALLMVERIGESGGPPAGAQDYEPLPSEGLQAVLAGLSRSPQWLPVLRRIRELARSRAGWVRFHAARLFHDSSQGFALPSVEVLAEWVDGGGPVELEAVSALLEEAPPPFLFAHLSLVANLLRRAHAAGNACFERVRSSLFSVATGQARPRTGRPVMSESVLKEQAREASFRLERGTPEQRFFESLAKHAEALLLEEDAEQDDELFDDGV
jgi:hypothetical protein